MINMALDDSIREMFAMIELEIRRLRHDRTEIYTRAVQPILWLGVFGTIMGRVNAIPIGGLPYIDYIEGDWNFKEASCSPHLHLCHGHRPVGGLRCASGGPGPDNIPRGHTAGG
jgi:hypothetical protein